MTTVMARRDTERSVVLRIALVGIILLALMFMLRDGRFLKGAGVLASCEQIAAPVGQSGDWRKCTAGKIDGRRDLTTQDCTLVRSDGPDDYWVCTGQAHTGA